MGIQAWLSSLLVLTLVHGQDDNVRRFSWGGFNQVRKLPSIGSLLPYNGYPQEATTVSYSQILDEFKDIPFSSDFGSQASIYDDNSLSSYEDSGREFNITAERIGGFGGTGDTRGYGAYDFPKNQANNYPEPKIEENPFPDILKIGRDRNRFPNFDPLYVRPLPPPL